MKKAYLTGIRRIELRDVPEPRVERADDVLIRIDTVGVCGSDLHYYREGRIGVQVVEFPFAVGHECAGVVVQAGAKAEGLRQGQRVAVDPLVVCGRCDQCRSGRQNTCRNQKFLGCPGQLEGSMAEYLVMPARSVLPMPGGVSFEQAVMAEPLSVALWAQRLAGPTAGRRIAVLGCGPIGLCVIQALRAAGEARIYATDLLDNRVRLALATGAHWAANAAQADVVAELAKLEPNGLDLVFECAGVQDTIDQAGKLLAPGGAVLVIGIPPDSRLSFDMNDYRRKELTVRNVRRQNACHADALAMIAAGRAEVDAQITHRFSLEQSQQAFDLVADYRDGVVKAMIHIPD